MDMLKGEQIAEADLTDWRKLAQGLHARYVVGDFGTGARFVVAVGEAGDAVGHHPRVSIGHGYVDLKLVTDDAIYRDGQPHRTRPRHGAFRDHRAGVGRPADRER
jgi:4a-hydroxytetrahydrobiopterin dehydratase